MNKTTVATNRIAQSLEVMKGYKTGVSSSCNNALLVEYDGKVYKLTVEQVEAEKVDRKAVDKFL